MKKLSSLRTFTTGVAVAPIFVVEKLELHVPHHQTENVPEEQKRLVEAISSAEADLKQLAEKEDIFAAHLELLTDPSLQEDILQLIESDGKTAEWATEEVISGYADMFRMMEDEYMKEREADIRDIGERIQLKLMNRQDTRLSTITSHVILAARDLTPSDTAKMDFSLIDGFLTEEGGITSHVAIIAKSLGIPALVGVPMLMDSVTAGQMAAMNAASGEVFLDPDAATIEVFKKHLQQQDCEKAAMQEAAKLPAKTADGTSVVVYANVGSLEDIDRALAFGATGIGLLRTEFLYMNASHFPTEDEQYEIYAAAAKKLGNRELIVRTLDIGGDKTLPYYTFDREDNPFLGYRAIRLCLDQPEVFKTQLRALLRASVHGNLKIMYPMIVDPEELSKANALLSLCKQELKDREEPYRDDVSVGMMIETPASVLLAEDFAQQVDFFSIGTNDLTQYMLAADRGNPKLFELYNSFRPAVVRAIGQVIEAGHKHGIPVGMCGEFAGDPVALELLLGLGLDEFSVSAGTIPKIKKSLNCLTVEECRLKSKLCLQAKSKDEILKIVTCG